MTARLYLDENIVPELARILRTRGFDVVSVHEVGAAGLPDEEQLRRATADGRTLLTCDYHDFLPIFSEWLAAGRDHAGIVVSYRQYRRDELRPLAEAVQRLLATLDSGELRNSLQTLDSFRTSGELLPLPAPTSGRRGCCGRRTPWSGSRIEQRTSASGWCSW